MQLLGESSSSILKKPDQLLTFIRQVLESTTAPKERPELTTSLGSNKLELGEEENDSDDESDGGDSDDDDPASEVIKPDDEMLETTLNLLLAVLESEYDDTSIPNISPNLYQSTKHCQQEPLLS